MKIILFLIPMFLLFSCASKEKTPSPNVVLFYIDDMGYGDLGSYGAVGFTTPNLDKLAANGMRFTNFYSPQPVCSASRAGLLSGCYPNRIGISGALFPASQAGINPEEKILPEIFKEKGYTTAIFGKWHLGHHEQFLPLQNGFDEYTGLPYSNDMWPVGFDGKPRENSNSPPLPLIEGNKTVRLINTLKDQDELTTIYTEKAVDFINRKSKDPFFLYIPHTMVHIPLGVSDKFRGKSEQGLYGDVMMEIDWSVGEVINALKKNNIYENTLVIFTSDNGPWLTFGNHAGSTNGLREGKITTYEGGQRVPAIFSWPGTIPEGTISNRLACAIDILPTLTNIIGGELPENKIDGVDIGAILTGDVKANPRNELYYYFGKNRLEAVRKGNWKLVLEHPLSSAVGGVPGKDGFPGKMVNTTTVKGLFDLRRDPGENYNVIEQYPEIAEDLEKLVEKAREDLGDELTNRTGKNVRESGWVGEKPVKRKDITHLGMKGKVLTLSKPHENYSFLPSSMLLDGSFGKADDFSISWIGYQLKDAEFIIDLGEKTKLKQINASFLRNYSGWIFLPPSIKYFVSNDNKSYREVGSFQNENKENNTPMQALQFPQNIEEEARYIKVTAKNIGKCPSWHQGSGESGWLFIDEIVIR